MNITYAWLCGRCADTEQREKLDADLYAPADGTDPDRAFWFNLARLAEQEG